MKVRKWPGNRLVKPIRSSLPGRRREACSRVTEADSIGIMWV